MSADQTATARFDLTFHTLSVGLAAPHAEAAEAEWKGEAITLPEAFWAEAADQQDARREDDPWLDILASVKGKFENDEIRVSSKHLMSDVLEIPVDRQMPHVAKRLADCMKRLGWSGPEKMRIEGQSVRGFRRRPKDGEEVNYVQDEMSF